MSKSFDYRVMIDEQLWLSSDSESATMEKVDESLASFYFEDQVFANSSPNVFERILSLAQPLKK